MPDDSSIRIRATVTDGVADIKILINHPMESGLRTDAWSGQVVPAHYVTEVSCELAGRTILTAYTSGMVSKDPYFGIRHRGAQPGDVLRVRWVDNLGEGAARDYTLS